MYTKGYLTVVHSSLPLCSLVFNINVCTESAVNKEWKSAFKNVFLLFCHSLFLSLSLSLPLWLFILLFEEIYTQLFLLKSLQQTGNRPDLCDWGKK